MVKKKEPLNQYFNFVREREREREPDGPGGGIGRFLEEDGREGRGRGLPLLNGKGKSRRYNIHYLIL